MAVADGGGGGGGAARSRKRRWMIFFSSVFSSLTRSDREDKVSYVVDEHVWWKDYFI